jgi:hypothetical protein
MITITGDAVRFANGIFCIRMFKVFEPYPRSGVAFKLNFEPLTFINLKLKQCLVINP